MADWRDRSEMNGDVVFFRYVSESVEKSNEEVFIWDLDKTYLDTTIDSFAGLMRTILERAFNKKNVPGTNTLIQALSNFRFEQRGQKYFPIYFITASPPQMEERISEKIRSGYDSSLWLFLQRQSCKSTSEEILATD